MAEPAKILIVDDDPDFLESTRAMLAGGGYRVAVSAGEDEALTGIEADPPDLVILDLMMSRWDSGLLLARKLKSDKRFGAIPIVMVTAVDKASGLDLARHAGCGDGSPSGQVCLPVDGYVVKPVTIAELLPCVRSILARAGQGAAPR